MQAAQENRHQVEKHTERVRLSNRTPALPMYRAAPQPRGQPIPLVAAYPNANDLQRVLIAYHQTVPLHIVQEDDDTTLATTWLELLINLEHTTRIALPGHRSGDRQKIALGKKDTLKDVLITLR